MSVLRHLTVSAVLTLVAAAPASAAVSFGPGKAFPSTEASGGVALGDFDGDGDRDLAYTVAPTSGPGAIGVRANNGAGAFGAETRLPTNEQPQNLAAGDLNGDGRTDLVTVTNNPGQDSLTTFLSGAGGLGAQPVVQDTASGPRAVELADMDRDGDLDAIVSGFVGGRGAGRPPVAAAVHLNAGNGTFGQATEFQATQEGEPTDVAAGDFNRDGITDVALADFNFGTGGRIHVLLGTGGGALGAPTTLAAPNDATEVIARDLNSDGAADLVIGGNQPGRLLADGSGGFGSPATFAGATATGAELGVGDINGDGRTDIVVEEGGLRVFIGDGSGGFKVDPGRFAPEGYSRAFAAGDFTGDGLDDVAAASFGVAVYPNSGAPATKAKLSGVPRGCAKARFKLRVKTGGSFRSVEVRVDGKRVSRSARASFTVTVRASKRGRHRVQAIVTPRSGKKLKTTKTFRRC